ncbi:TraI/MobA(P) family conjugative relaxase [Legionella anisa]|uniref:Conjugal transfer protein TraI n=3 Tax=Legionella anisa TaxID=28082 RepID=A0AAX0WPW7_9GAMM|nr:TraI/MobA(P) family conjugative relaxase [Legionella anisa]AWN73031.1 conjugal transfer protein TraI [Legionella anisa]KTC75653.1 TraI protein [Legionella anisa]MCW8423852.1 relaxase/mobilization nuclease domain-containing protein [Legionella anisa]MCW8447374.1 relaxase/mobilization nuclease domain-containing protein [Legionella anisa]PNL60150.1 conjugal transfer protein TraI [Legionella anisa]
MIIRHIPMKKTRLSSFSGLVQYLCNKQNKQERVGKVRLTNCNSIDLIWAVQEVLATQAKNQRARGDKTYHMLISFAPGENPSPQALQEIEDKVASSIGFKEHQRISVVHHDTDNLHIHVAINKIHPKTFNMIEPYRAYKTFADIASSLEIELGLKITNHQTRKSHSENLADDMEQHSGIESLINWMKRNCKEQIEAAQNWSDLHKVLAKHHMRIQVRANGFIFCDEDGLTVKASSVSRNFSKQRLESKLGEFEPLLSITNLSSSNVYRYEPLNKTFISSELYAQYQHEKAQSQNVHSAKLKYLREAKAKLIDKAKKRGRMKRTGLKLMNLSRMSKKFLYQQISKTLLHDIENIRKNYTHARHSLMENYQNKTWADWLQKKAQSGDKDALMAMRYRNRKNNSNYTISGTDSVFSSFNFGQIDSVTKEGTEIYKKDNAIIRDNGKEIVISKGGSIPVLKRALEMARQRYGDCICMNGSPQFKKIILQIVIQYQMPITFADLDLENQRPKLNLEQEKSHEQSRSNRQNHRRRAPGSHETVGTANDNRKIRDTKSNSFSIRQGSPAKDHNSLRNLSKCDLVQLTGGGQVLLQDNAHDQLERQRLQPDNHVRWKVFGINEKSKSRKK